VVIHLSIIAGDSPYPGKIGKDVPMLLETGYRMPKPEHVSDKM
jgi:hypothetical protein